MKFKFYVWATYKVVGYNQLKNKKPFCEIKWRLCEPLTYEIGQAYRSCNNVLAYFDEVDRVYAKLMGMEKILEFMHHPDPACHYSINASAACVSYIMENFK